MGDLLNINPTIYDVMSEFFRDQEFTVRPVGDDPILVMNVRGEHSEWRCYAEAHEEYNRFRFFSVLQVFVPEEKRAVMAEFLTRANYGLPIGAFEMDYRDGEIRFRTSTDLTELRPTKIHIQNTVFPNLMMVDLYYQGIMSIVYSDTTPAQAIAEIEGPPTPLEGEGE